MCKFFAAVVVGCLLAVSSLVSWWANMRLYAEGSPMHVVVTWNGAGAREWNSAAAAACRAAGAEACDEDARKQFLRRTQRDELKYALRSLDAHLPWYGGVVTLLTDGSPLPTWLDGGSPRLRLLRHEDLWTDPAALPSYSSAALETRLADLFPLLNDAPGAPKAAQMLLMDGNHHVLGGWLGPSDVFRGPQQPVVRMVGLVERGWKKEGSFYSSSVGLAASLFEEVDADVSVPRQHVLGAPVALLESVLVEACMEWADVCQATAARRFPARNDLPLVFMHNHLGDGGVNTALNEKFVEYMEAILPCPSVWERDHEGRDWCRLKGMGVEFTADVQALGRDTALWMVDVWNGAKNQTLTGSARGDQVVISMGMTFTAVAVGVLLRVTGHAVMTRCCRRGPGGAPGAAAAAPAAGQGPMGGAGATTHSTAADAGGGKPKTE